MLRPNGVAIVTTPFFVKVHNSPQDCSRWTELGIKYLFSESGFKLERITTGSWGNRSCVVANFNGWARWIPFVHSLKNEKEFPITVWIFAQK